MPKFRIMPILDNRVDVYLDKDHPGINVRLEIKQDQTIGNFFSDIFSSLKEQAKINQETLQRQMNGVDIEIEKTQQELLEEQLVFVQARSELDLENPNKSQRKLILIVEGGSNLNKKYQKNVIQSQRVLNMDESLQELLWKKPLHLTYTVYLEKVVQPQTYLYRVENNYEYIQAIESVFQAKQYIRKGKLYKMRKDGSFKKRFFMVYDKYLLYSDKSKDENEKCIFLQNARVKYLDKCGPGGGWSDRKQKYKFQIKSENKQKYVLMANSCADMQGWFNVLFERITILQSQKEIEIYDKQIQDSRYNEDRVFVDEIIRNFSDFIYILKDKHQLLKKFLFYQQMDLIDKQLDQYFIDTMHKFYYLTISNQSILNQDPRIRRVKKQLNDIREQQLQIVKHLGSRILDFIQQKRNNHKNRRHFYHPKTENGRSKGFYQYADVDNLKGFLEGYIRNCKKSQKEIEKEVQKREAQKQQNYIFGRLSQSHQKFKFQSPGVKKKQQKQSQQSSSNNSSKQKDKILWGNISRISMSGDSDWDQDKAKLRFSCMEQNEIKQIPDYLDTKYSQEELSISTIKSKDQSNSSSRNGSLAKQISMKISESVNVRNFTSIIKEEDYYNTNNIKQEDLEKENRTKQHSKDVRKDVENYRDSKSEPDFHYQEQLSEQNSTSNSQKENKIEFEDQAYLSPDKPTTGQNLINKYIQKNVQQQQEEKERVHEQENKQLIKLNLCRNYSVNQEEYLDQELIENYRNIDKREYMRAKTGVKKEDLLKSRLSSYYQEDDMSNQQESIKEQEEDSQDEDEENDSAFERFKNNMSGQKEQQQQQQQQSGSSSQQDLNSSSQSITISDINKSGDEDYDDESEDIEELRKLEQHMEESEVLVTLVVKYLEQKYYQKFVAKSGLNEIMQEIPVKAYSSMCEEVRLDQFLENLNGANQLFANRLTSKSSGSKQESRDCSPQLKRESQDVVINTIQF